MSTHYQSSHFGPNQYISNHYGRDGVVLPDEHVHPPGTSRRRIMEEDEEIMAIIMAFLEIKDH